MATKLLILAVVILMFAGAGCYQEGPSENPPIHINPNMDDQPKYRPQEESEFFADGATMRVPVAGTVAQGELHVNIEYYTGKSADGEFIEGLPDTVALAIQLLRRGQERYNIFCSPCHGRVGDGRGIIVNRDYVPPPTFHSERLREIQDGYLFDVVANGIRNMPAYRYQVPVDDRWAIVSYLRALQRSQNASLEDIPEPLREKVK